MRFTWVQTSRDIWYHEWMMELERESEKASNNQLNISMSFISSVSSIS